MPVVMEVANEESETSPLPPPTYRIRKEIGNGDGPRDGDELAEDSGMDDEDMPPLEDFVDESVKNKNEGKKIVIEDKEEPKNVDEDGWLDILGSGELKKRVIKKGEGQDTRPQRSNWIVINMKGTLDNGTVFDDRKALRIILGDLEVCCGLDIAIALMERGEVSEIRVPPRFGYGKLGFEPDVPPDATLHYEVELLSSSEAKDETELPFQERQAIGDAKRERGNFWYSRGEYSNAAHCYRRALDFLDDMGLNLAESPADLQLLLDTRLKVYNNLTAAQMKMEAYEAALKSVDFVIKVQPSNVKALYRKGKILACQGNVSEAVAVLKKALKLEPETKIIQQELSRLQVKKDKQDRAEKAMYRRMFASTTDGDDDTRVKGSKGSRYDKVRNWTWVAGGLVAAAAVGVATYRHLATV